MQGAVLHESSEGEDEADRDKEVHSSDVGDFRQGLPGDGAQSCHGEHRGDTYRGHKKRTRWFKFMSILFVCKQGSVVRSPHGG